ncbi:hypothetical protein F4810DRAFT_649561 [Camillea tinctor]|nr:hypothetical protein F4810DRAFT_649561 [Camillea tinctor]
MLMNLWFFFFVRLGFMRGGRGHVWGEVGRLVIGMGKAMGYDIMMAHMGLHRQGGIYHPRTCGKAFFFSFSVSWIRTSNCYHHLTLSSFLDIVSNWIGCVMKLLCDI